MITKYTMEFCCVFAKEFDLDLVVILVSDFDTVIRIFVVSQDSPSRAVLCRDLLYDVAENFKNIIASTTCVQKII